MSSVNLKINLDKKLVAKLEPLLLERGLTLDQTCSLYLRSLVTASEKTRAVGLDDEMPIGKFKGEPLETVIRAEPRYISWLLSEMKNFSISPEALVLLEEQL